MDDGYACYIDDGSGLKDGSTHEENGQQVPNTGVRVNGAYSIYETGSLVEVTGIIGTTIINGKVARCLKVRAMDSVNQDVTTRPETSEPSRVTMEDVGGPTTWNALSLPLPPAAGPFTMMGLTGKTAAELEWCLGGWSPAEHRSVFLEPAVTNVKWGAGYWMRFPGLDGVSYNAVSDDTTDRWRSVIPYVNGQNGEFNLIAHPLDHDVAWADLMVTDGTRTETITRAWELGWISPAAWWWQSSTQSLRCTDLPPEFATYPDLKSWQGYFVCSFKPVGLVFPGETHPTTARGSISATVRDTSSNPINGARVYCSYGSALTTGGSAAIGNLPAGTYLVTASASGYKSRSKLVTVTAGPPQSVDFSLEGRLVVAVGVYANPGRIPPDGASTSTIAIYVADQEGVPLGNKNVTLTTDAGRFQNDQQSISVTTSDQGTAQATLRSDTTPTTATLTATCESSAGRGYVEFAAADAPSVRIVSPASGETVASTLTIVAEAWDSLGENPGVLTLGFFVDGECVGNSSTYPQEFAIDSSNWLNGSHILRVAACDKDGVVGYSQALSVCFDNPVHQVSVSGTLFNPMQSEFLSVSGSVRDQGYTWTVRVDDGSTEDVFASREIWSVSGESTQIDVQWLGMDNLGNPVPDGPYRYVVLLTPTGQPLGGGTSTVASAGTASRTTLQPGEVEGLVMQCHPEGHTNFSQVATWAYKQFRSNNNGRMPIRTLFVPFKEATWARMSQVLQGGSCAYLFIVTHGLTDRVKGPDGVAYDHSWFEIGTRTRVYPMRPPGYPEAGANLKLHDFTGAVYYLDGLGLWGRDQMELVVIYACCTGYVGSYWDGEDEETTVYQVSSANDMAWTFGTYYSGGAYVSLRDYGYMKPNGWSNGRPPASFTYTGFWREFWGAMGNNYDVWHSFRYIWLFHNEFADYCFDGYPMQRRDTNDRRFWEYRPSYLNVRVFGNPYAKLP